MGITKNDFLDNHELKKDLAFTDDVVSLFMSQKIYPLILNPFYSEINVESQENKPNSPLNYYRNLMKFRNNNEIKEILTKGKLNPLKEGKEMKTTEFQKNDFKNNPVVAAYTITYKGKKLLVVTELGNEPEVAKIHGFSLDEKKIVKPLTTNVHKVGNTLRFKD